MFLDIANSFISQLDKFNNNKYHLIIIDDNQTCSNSTYLVIQWPLCLRRRVKKFYSIRFNKN